MRVALLFIDGVGIGRKDPAVNPLAHREHLLSHFEDAPS
ncbi:metalloenzyme, partial [Myxococcus xanthus]|nr:metalloenzyme [Myxococcus xanthus]NOK07116.1 metalloenzyme [Myxococcus xanthus]